MRQTRTQAIEHARRLLLRQGWPRVQMTLMLSLTGGVGFLVSFMLLRAGMTQMWLRYPIAILVAYSGFLLLLRLWLYLQQPERQPEGPDLDSAVLDGLNAGDALAAGLSSGGDATTFGGGGDFGGGGAGGSWGSIASGSPVESLSPVGSSSSSSGGLLGTLDVGGDDGCGVIIAVIALVVALLGALLVAFYVVYAAPALLAEILVDGLLVGGLYRSLKGVEQRHWLRTAVRKTLLPLALVLAFFIAAGYVAQRAVPEARSVGDLWRRLTVE